MPTPSHSAASPTPRTRAAWASIHALRSGAIAALVALAGTSAATAQTVDPTQAGPPLKGWGTSLAWWANITGRWNDDAAFESLMDDVFNVEDGLGLTIVRLNIGAGQRPDLSNNGYMGAGRLMPSYQDGPDEPFVPQRDRAQTRVLLESIERGVQYVEANGNSPPWWMTITQDASGNPNGSNLSPANHGAYAEYLATVAQWYQDEHGITFNSLTPLNEPSASWWDGDGNQEGCTIPPSQQPSLLATLRDTLDGFGLEEIPVSGPEEWSSALTLSSLQSYPSDVADDLSHIATHTYNTNNRAGLNAYAEATGKALWMSEYGTGAATEYDSAMQLARRIIGDFREMPSLEAWIIWQVMSTNHFSHTWACMLSNFSSVTPSYTFRPQYFTFANFSRYIRPGSRFIESGDSNSLAAFQPGMERLVIVAINDSTTSRVIEYDLSAFDDLPGAARRIRTSRTENLAELNDQPLFNVDTLRVRLDAESVTTFIVDGVSTPELPRTDWNGDSRLTQADALDFLDAQERNADETDITLDNSRDFFDTLDFLASQDETGLDANILNLTFEGLADGDLGETSFGNGSSGGSYLAEDRLYIQAFASEGEEGGAAVPLNGVFLEAGVEHTIRVRAGDFNQGWTTGGTYLVGLHATEPGLTTSPDIASAVFSAPENNGPLPVAFITRELTFTPSASISAPYLLLRTNDVANGNQRVAFEAVEITRHAIP